jgi:Fe-S oxidoreductase
METVTPLAEIVEEIKEAGGEAFKYCYQCGKCDVVCPWNRVRPFSIRKIVWQAALGLPEIEFDEIWRCTTCGRCPSLCPRGVEQIEVGVAIRRIATAYDVFPASVGGISTAGTSLASDGNPLGEERDKRDAWASGLDVKPFQEGMEVLLFVGCYYAYDPRMRKVAEATVDLLKRAGVDFGILGSKESCCGESIRKAGNEEVFKSLARENIKTFIDHGVKKVLVASPHCYHTFKNEYREFMVHLDVVHISRFLLDLVEGGHLELSGAGFGNGGDGVSVSGNSATGNGGSAAANGGPTRKVTFHDPCYLGRHNGIFEEPRQLLAKLNGLELVEMPDTRQDSLCCGGGGGRIWAETPKEERFSDLRLEQAVEVGAEVLATSCPYCISNFEESRLALGEGAPEVKDITEVLLEALNGGGGPAAESPGGQSENGGNGEPAGMKGDEGNP